MAYRENKLIENDELQIGRRIRRQFRVYLDINFWISLRNIYMLRDKDHQNVAIFNHLMRLCEQGICICPVSEATFMEATKQTDIETLSAFAKCVDIFSAGIAIKNYFSRYTVEFEGFVRAVLSKTDLFNLPAFERIWTRTGYIMGEFSMTSPKIDNDRSDELSYMIFRQATFTQLVAGSPNFKRLESDASNYKRLAEELTNRPDRSEDKKKSLRELFLEEVGGIAPDISRNLIKVLPKISNTNPTDEELGQSQEQLQNMLYNGFRLKPNLFMKAFPNLYLDAMLHAGMRSDYLRKYKPNDFLDFKHASAGIPYCNVLATDKPLHALITKIKLEKNYNTIVVSTFKDLGDVLYRTFPSAN